MDSEKSLVAEHVELEEVTHEKPGMPVLGQNKRDLVRGVKTKVVAVLGSIELTVGDLLDLKRNAVITLDQRTDELIDLIVDGVCVARGNLVVVDDKFGIEIVDVSDN